MFKPALLIALAALALAPAADTAGSGDKGGCRGQWRQKILDKFDANHDGKLDDTERAAARAALAARLKEKHPELLAKIDTNGDGVISKEEMQAGRELLRQWRQQRREARGTAGTGTKK